MTIIRDPQQSYAAKVDSNHRLWCRSTVSEEDIFFTVQGNSYLSTTEDIVLTSGNESAVWFLRSREDFLLNIKSIRIDSSESVGGTGLGTVRIYRNPEGGTIESTATPMQAILNRNFAVSRTSNVEAYSGFEGATVGPSQGSGGLLDIFTPASDVRYPFEILLGKDNTIAVTVQPPAGNTNMTVSVKPIFSVTDLTLAGVYGS